MKRCGIFLLALLLILMLGPVHVMAAQSVADGQYTIEVSLSGGTGRASIDSPATLTAANGKVTAIIVWNSPYYEYMLVDGVYFDPIQTEGNATFEIPVVLDEDMAISAQTIAMSQPHEIDYILHFDSATIKPLNETGIPANMLLAAGCAAAVLAVCIVVIVRRKQREKFGKSGAK